MFLSKLSIQWARSSDTMETTNGPFKCLVVEPTRLKQQKRQFGEFSPHLKTQAKTLTIWTNQKQNQKRNVWKTLLVFFQQGAEARRDQILKDFRPGMKRGEGRFWRKQ